MTKSCARFKVKKKLKYLQIIRDIRGLRREISFYVTLQSAFLIYLMFKTIHNNISYYAGK